MGDISGNGTAVTGLGGAAGYGEVMLPRGDDSVARVDVSAVFGGGFTIGGAQYAADQLYISTDGLISFGAGFSGVAATAAAIAAPFFAIFNADVDTRLDGEGAESGGIWLDIDTAQDCVTITWDNVGFYRRNATATDTFQLQIFDRGNGAFDVVYRYQDIRWTSGDLQGGWGGLGGAAALIGYWAGVSGAASLLAASGSEAAQLGLPDAIGNTGVKGLWVYSFGAASVITGTALADTLQGTAANDTLRGLDGADVLMGSTGADVMDGGPGLDHVDYGTATAALMIDLITASANTGQAADDSFAFIETFAGSAFGDTLLGGGAADAFLGANGPDLLDGRGGSDSLYGGAGRDSLVGGDGDDALSGGSDGDTLSGGIGNDGLSGGIGNDRINGNAGGDLLQGASGADTIFGDDGDDLIGGGTGHDQLWGGTGLDDLKGGAGNDLLDGGLAEDRLTGGPGADGFSHAGTGGQGCDWVLDFDTAQGDRLIFGIAGAVQTDFSVTFQTVAGAGKAGVQEALITYLPLSRLVWVLVDGADEASILLQSSMNSFDLL